MGNPRGVKRDFVALERRRLEALKLLKQGYNQSEVARRVKVCSQTVSRWARAVSAQGEKALSAAGRAGRKPLLDDQQRERLIGRLLEGPERLGYETPLWTCNRVEHLIQEEFGIRYHSGHVWKLLRQLNWSPQRPAGRALERNEEAIDHWKRKTWPGIKKSLKRRAHARLHRRKRVESASPSVSHLGSTWSNSCAAVPLQLEDHIRCCRNDHMELLFPDLRKGGRQGRNDSLPDSPPPIYPNTAIGGLGQAASAPQSAGGSVPGFLGRPDRHRISSALCAGTQSGGIPVGSLEATYVA
jgi:transposase